jgi:hypothetical protein
MASVPAHTDSLALLPESHVRAEFVDDPSDFVSGDAWIFEAGPLAFFYQKVAVADSTDLDFDADGVGSGGGDGAVYEVEAAAGGGDLDGFHFF